MLPPFTLELADEGTTFKRTPAALPPHGVQRLTRLPLVSLGKPYPLIYDESFVPQELADEGITFKPEINRRSVQLAEMVQEKKGMQASTGAFLVDHPLA